MLHKYWPWIQCPEPLLSYYPHYSMEHASVADLSVFDVAHLALNLKTSLGQVDGEGPCNTNSCDYNRVRLKKKKNTTED